MCTLRSSYTMTKHRLYLTIHFTSNVFSMRGAACINERSSSINPLMPTLIQPHVRHGQSQALPSVNRVAKLNENCVFDYMYIKKRNLLEFDKSAKIIYRNNSCQITSKSTSYQGPMIQFDGRGEGRGDNFIFFNGNRFSSMQNLNLSSFWCKKFDTRGTFSL